LRFSLSPQKGNTPVVQSVSKDIFVLLLFPKKALTGFIRPYLAPRPSIVLFFIGIYGGSPFRSPFLVALLDLMNRLVPPCFLIPLFPAFVRNPIFSLFFRFYKDPDYFASPSLVVNRLCPQSPMVQSGNGGFLFFFPFSSLFRGHSAPVFCSLSANRAFNSTSGLPFPLTCHFFPRDSLRVVVVRFNGCTT